jgi:hypothetical protein
MKGSQLCAEAAKVALFPEEPGEDCTVGLHSFFASLLDVLGHLQRDWKPMPRNLRL